MWFARFSAVSGNTQVLIQRPNGLALRTQGFLGGLTSRPRLAPDEAHIAYVGSEGDIVVTDASGGSGVIWGGCRASAGSPVFAPDGQSFLCLFSDLALYRIGIDLSNTKLSPDGVPISSGTWSPDGSALAFRVVGQFGVSNGIYVMPLATAVPQLIREQPEDDFDSSPPIWSPDGSQILFGGNLAPLWVMEASGFNPRIVADTADGVVPEGQPAWSPDGQRIAFAACARQSQPFVVGLDGSSLTQITDGFQSVGEPSWSPDGSTLVFTGRLSGATTGNPNGRVFLVNPDGSGVLLN